MPWRDASDYGDEGYGFPFDQEGWKFCSFASTTQPGVVDRRAKPILKDNDVYSGMKARVTYAPWAYDKEEQRRDVAFEQRAENRRRRTVIG